MIDVCMALDQSVSSHTGVRTIQNTGVFSQAVFQPPRPNSLSLEHGSAAKTLIAPTRYRQLRRLSLRRMTQSASVLNSGAHSFRFLGSQKLPCFFNFPVSRARPEKLCDYYWLQLQITCKSGWIAQPKKRYCVSKEGKSKLTAQRRTKTQGSRSNGARLGLGRLKILSRRPSRATCWCWFPVSVSYSQKAKNVQNLLLAKSQLSRWLRGLKRTLLSLRNS